MSAADSPTVFFILGGPGSGKGTNCERLVEDFGYTHLSAGDLLRAAAKEDSDLGRQITEIMKSGSIVPSEVTVALLKSAVEQRPNPVGFLIDGFPRKADQAQMFEEGIVQAKGIFYFDCSEKVMEERLLDRASQGSGRSDDNIETIRRRFRVNVEECMPVVEKYKTDGRCYVIDADAPKDEVYEKVKAIFISLGAKPKNSA